MNIKQLIIILACSVTIAGCNESNGNAQKPKHTDVRGVYEITLKDGTRCALFDGYKAGGISCDWGNLSNGAAANE